MGYDWSGKTVIVTGAGTGVGKALCGEIAARGASVYVTARSHDKCEPVAAAIRAAGYRAVAEPLDVCDYEQFTAVIDRVTDQHGRLDVLINNAAVLFVGEFFDMDEAGIERLVQTNLTSVLVSTLYAYRVMKAQGHGKIVNVSSMGGYLPNATMVAYAATKFGVNGLTASLAAEAEEFGVDLQVVCLGFVESEMLNKAEMRHGGAATVHEMLPYKPQPVGVAAVNVVNGIENNQRFIFTPFYARAFWWLNRLSPKALHIGAVQTMSKYRAIINRTSGDRAAARVPSPERVRVRARQ